MNRVLVGSFFGFFKKRNSANESKRSTAYRGYTPGTEEHKKRSSQEVWPANVECAKFDVKKGEPDCTVQMRKPEGTSTVHEERNQNTRWLDKKLERLDVAPLNVAVDSG